MLGESKQDKNDQQLLSTSTEGSEIESVNKGNISEGSLDEEHPIN